MGQVDGLDPVRIRVAVAKGGPEIAVDVARQRAVACDPDGLVRYQGRRVLVGRVGGDDRRGATRIPTDEVSPNRDSDRDAG